MKLIELKKFTNKLVYDLIDNDFLSSNNIDRHIKIIHLISIILKKFGPGGYYVLENRNRYKISFTITINNIDILFNYDINSIVRRKKINKIYESN